MQIYKGNTMMNTEETRLSPPPPRRFRPRHARFGLNRPAGELSHARTCATIVPVRATPPPSVPIVATTTIPREIIAPLKTNPATRIVSRDRRREPPFRPRHCDCRGRPLQSSGRRSGLHQLRNRPPDRGEGVGRQASRRLRRTIGHPFNQLTARFRRDWSVENLKLMCRFYVG